MQVGSLKVEIVNEIEAEDDEICCSFCKRKIRSIFHVLFSDLESRVSIRGEKPHIHIHLCGSCIRNRGVKND